MKARALLYPENFFDPLHQTLRPPGLVNEVSPLRRGLNARDMIAGCQQKPYRRRPPPGRYLHGYREDLALRRHFRLPELRTPPRRRCLQPAAVNPEPLVTALHRPRAAYQGNGRAISEMGCTSGPLHGWLFSRRHQHRAGGLFAVEREKRNSARVGYLFTRIRYCTVQQGQAVGAARRSKKPAIVRGV